MLNVIVAIALIGAVAALFLVAAARAASNALTRPALPETERSEIVEAPNDEVTATHEAGHVILAWTSPFVTEITEVALDEGGESGVTKMTRGAVSGQTRLWDAIAISLAGIAAEGYAFGRFSTSGSHRDLKKARDWAEELATTVRNAPTTAPWRPPVSRSAIDVGRMFEERPDDDVCAVLNAAYRHAKSVIAVRPDAFRALAHAIRARGTLSAHDVEAILGPRPWAIFAPRK